MAAFAPPGTSTLKRVAPSGSMTASKVRTTPPGSGPSTKTRCGTPGATRPTTSTTPPAGAVLERPSGIDRTKGGGPGTSARDTRPSRWRVTPTPPSPRTTSGGRRPRPARSSASDGAVTAKASTGGLGAPQCSARWWIQTGPGTTPSAANRTATSSARQSADASAVLAPRASATVRARPARSIRPPQVARRSVAGVPSGGNSAFTATAVVAPPAVSVAEGRGAVPPQAERAVPRSVVARTRRATRRSITCR